MPENWAFTRLKDIGIYASGKTPNNNELSNSGILPYYKVSDMNTIGNEKYMTVAGLFLSDNYNGVVFPANSIIFPKNGGAVLTNKKRILTENSVVDLNTGVFTPSELLCFDFIYYYFTTIDFRGLFKGGVLPTLDRSVIEERFIVVPPYAEQSRIAKTVKSQFEILDMIMQALS